MRRRLLLFIPLILVLGFAFLLWRGLQHNPNDQDNAIIGRPLPDATATDLLEPTRQVALRSLRGKPFVLNVWASWCPNCRAEHPFLMRLAQKVDLHGLAYRDRPDAARDWLARSGNPFKSVLNDQQGSIALELGVYGTPETLLFSGDGVLLARYTGEMTDEIWAKTFAPRLATTAGGKTP